MAVPLCTDGSDIDQQVVSLGIAVALCTDGSDIDQQVVSLCIAVAHCTDGSDIDQQVVSLCIAVALCTDGSGALCTDLMFMTGKWSHCVLLLLCVQMAVIMTTCLDGSMSASWAHMLSVCLSGQEHSLYVHTVCVCVCVCVCWGGV